MKSVMEGDVEGPIEKGRPRMEFMKQIVIDLWKNSYKGLKKLGNDRDACKFTTNQSNV
jgi:hypothetical protein